MQAAMQPKPSRTDYSTITEQPGQRATRLQLAMLRTRYAWASAHAAQKDVAEIACGPGLGLGWIARMARSVEAGDLDDAHCRVARETYAGRENIHIETLDALHLPFANSSLDLVLLFEAIYYLPDSEAFFEEARRVLRPGGKLLLATVNCSWTGFNPSPFHVRYYSAPELMQAIERHGFQVHLRAGFPERRGILDWSIRFLRRMAVATRLIPQTMAGKMLLKRLFYGSLEPIPFELLPDGIAEILHPIEPGADLRHFRTLYAEARKVK